MQLTPIEIKDGIVNINAFHMVALVVVVKLILDAAEAIIDMTGVAFSWCLGKLWGCFGVETKK